MHRGRHLRGLDRAKRALDLDVASPALYNEYGLLADIGLRRDRPFKPDEELRLILTEAAKRADEELVVAAFADDAHERLVWPNRHWELVVYAEGHDGYYERDFLHLSAASGFGWLRSVDQGQEL